MKVLLIGTFASAGRPLLECYLHSKCEIAAFPAPLDEAKVLEEIADADVVIGAPFTKAMGVCARKLRLIQNTGVGTDRYDLSSFPPGVRLCVSYHHESAMAEYVIMAILALTRRLIHFDTRFRMGHWNGSCIFGPQFTTREISGTTLGLIGFGRIGTEVARRASALGMRVHAIKRDPATSAREVRVDFLGGPEDLPRLLAVSDYVVVTCPLTPQTEGLIGKEQLELMKRDGYLINVSRGRIIQEGALYEALRAGRIAGAALDVWYQYPPTADTSKCSPSAYPFHELTNVIMTPHISSCTAETVNARWKDIAFNIENLDKGIGLRSEAQIQR